MALDTIWFALRAFLLADPAIAARVGTRVYPQILPQNATLPAIVGTQTTGIRMSHLHGAASLARPRYQLDAWDSSFTGAATLGALIRARSEAYVGTMPDPRTSPVTDIITSMTFIDDREGYEDDVSGGSYRVSADYWVFHGTS